MKLFQTLKGKIIASCIGISCIFIAIFGTFIYQNAKYTHTKQQIESLNSKLNTVVNSIDQEYSQLSRLSISLSNDKIISTFLNGEEDFVSSDTYQLVTAYNECTHLLVNLGIYDLFSKGVLISNKHDYIINFGLVYGHPSDYDYFKELEAQMGADISGQIINNPFYWGGSDYIIPFRVPVYSYHSIHEAGILYFALNARIITQNFRDSDFTANGNLYIRMKDQLYVYDGTSIQNITAQFSSIDFPVAEQIDPQTWRTAAIPELDNHEFICVRSNSTGWSVMQQITPYRLSFSENVGITNIAIAIISVPLIFMLFYTYLNYSINRPITALIGQLDDIAKGNFAICDTSDKADEFRIIQAEINHMATALDALIAATLENEKQKKAYEFKILQSQINPHFLYNTLNSIRWLGEINGVPGISEITTALASMLRSIAKVNSQFVSIQTELSFIHDYVTIQHYRYGNIFTIEYLLEDETLNRAKIIKFILQPLVENAIFHGIEPSGRQGTIQIHIFTEEKDLLIQVKDNGIGIDPEQVDRLNRHDSDVSTDDIGLDNIHKRLVLEYGAPYGLTVESSKGNDTTITLRTLLEFEEDLQTK